MSVQHFLDEKAKGQTPYLGKFLVIQTALFGFVWPLNELNETQTIEKFNLANFKTSDHVNCQSTLWYQFYNLIDVFNYLRFNT